jgi:hypothetical protein
VSSVLHILFYIVHSFTEGIAERIMCEMRVKCTRSQWNEREMYSFTVKYEGNVLVAT